MPWQMEILDGDGDSLPDLLIRDIWTHDPGPPDGPAPDHGVWDYANLHAYNWESREYQLVGQYKVERVKGYLDKGCVYMGIVRVYLGRITRVDEDLGGVSTYYNYNVAGDLLKIKDIYGNEIVFT